MVEPAVPTGLQSDTMAAGDKTVVDSGGVARWAVDAPDPEIAVRANEYGDAIPADHRVVYTPQEYSQLPNYVSSRQTTVEQTRPGFQGGHHRDILPDKFAGKISWADYYSHFCVCMKLNGWTDREAAQFLASRLQGPALKVLHNLPDGEQISFRELVTQLERRFGPGQEAENFMLELRMRRRQKDESVQQLGQAIRDLTSLAYPEMSSDVRERLAKTHFSEAIDDAEIRAAIFRARPKTLNEAITAALATESFLHAERARERIRGPRHVRAVESNSPAPADEKMKREIQELKQNLNDVISMMKQLNQSRIKCYNCGEYGHMSTVCTKPKGNYLGPTRRTAGRPDSHTGPRN